MRLLSTKLLKVNFKDRLVQKGFSLVEFPFIKIKPLNTEIKTLEDNIIITSQNAASLVLNNPHLLPKLEGKNYFCVGEKTKMLLTGNGLKVIKMSQNASILSNFITKNHKNASFSFLCGIQRRPEIETELAKNKIPLSVHKIYDTLYNSTVIESQFDGILFFSPSAVESYFKKNTWTSETHGFCIGSTTAASLSNFTENFSVTKTPNENQLLLSIHHYNTHHYAQK